MNWDNVKSLIGKSAPLLSTLIGGPAGGVISLVAGALGTDETPEAIEAELQRNPEALLSLRTVQENNRAMLERLVLEQDNERFRQNHQTYRAELQQEDLYTKRWRPTFGYLVAFSWALMWVAMFYVLVFDTANAAAITAALVNTSALWGVALSVLGVYVHNRSKDKALATGITAGPGLLEKLKGLVS